MYVAVQCDGAALPNLTDSVTVTPHSGLFPYWSTVSYACPDGQRFDDGNTDVVVTCTGVGVWNWNPVVKSCGCEFISRPTKLCVCVGFFVGLLVGSIISKLWMNFHNFYRTLLRDVKSLLRHRPRCQKMRPRPRFLITSGLGLVDVMTSALYGLVSSPHFRLFQLLPPQLLVYWPVLQK